MAKGIYATQRTGGTSDALDYTDGSELSDGDVGIVNNGNVNYQYILDFDSGETADGLFVVEPVTNAGAKRWILQIPYGVGAQIGNGQTWQDVSDSREVNVTYTNTTDKPIFVSIYNYASLSGLTYPRLFIDEMVVSAQLDRTSSFNTGGTVCGIVPVGSTYKYSPVGDTHTWFELR